MISERKAVGKTVLSSTQSRFIEHLAEGPATFIIDDDDQGESADVVSIEETTDSVIVNLWHCKFAGGATPGARADDLYVVCGQAEKSTKWTWSFENLERISWSARTNIVAAVRQDSSGVPRKNWSRCEKAPAANFVVFRVGIVQPGLSKANAPPEHLAIIDGTNGFIRCTTGEPLTVYASD